MVEETGTVVAGIYGAILGGAAASGVSPSALCSALGVRALPPLEGARVAVATAKRVLNVAASRARSPRLPIAVGSTLACSRIDLVGFMILTAERGSDLGEVLPYQALVAEPSGWRMHAESDGIHLVQVGRGPSSAADRIWAEAELTSIVAGLRDAFGPVVPLRVAFRHRAPADVRGHRQYFGCETHFGADVAEVVLASEFGSRAARCADPTMFRYFRAHADAELSSLNRAIGLPDRVRQHVLVGLERGDATSATIARRLGMAERTLRRRLAEQGLRFQSIVDEVRHGAAESLLEDGERSVTEVAMLLGFSEASAFSRAFRRLSGRSPREYQHSRPKRTIV